MMVIEKEYSVKNMEFTAHINNTIFDNGKYLTIRSVKLPSNLDAPSLNIDLDQMLIDKVSFLKIIEEFDQAIISNKKENVAADFLFKNFSIYRKTLIQAINRAEFTPNNAYNRITELSPEEIIFNQSRLDLLERTREINLRTADSENRKSNAKRKTEYVYEVGNFVFVKNYNRSKLDPFYIGPAKVVTMHRNNNVVTLSLHESYGKR
ncbi:hypothetical protein CWI37_1757p0010, partial [Hamiltosporidium tvaerminnensis]